MGVDFSLRHTEMNPQFAQIAPPTELSVLLSFQIRVHESTGLMALCLPWRSIEPVANSLTARLLPGGRSGGARRAADELRWATWTIELRAEVGAVELTIDDVLALRRDDVISLGVPAEQGVTCWPARPPPTASSRARTGVRSPSRCTTASQRLGEHRRCRRSSAPAADEPESEAA